MDTKEQGRIIFGSVTIGTIAMLLIGQALEFAQEVAAEVAGSQIGTYLGSLEDEGVNNILELYSNNQVRFMKDVNSFYEDVGDSQNSDKKVFEDGTLVNLTSISDLPRGLLLDSYDYVNIPIHNRFNLPGALVPEEVSDIYSLTFTNELGKTNFYESFQLTLSNGNDLETYSFYDTNSNFGMNRISKSIISDNGIEEIYDIAIQDVLNLDTTEYYLNFPTNPIASNNHNNDFAEVMIPFMSEIREIDSNAILYLESSK